jgi:hypothetical protein
VSIIDEGKRWRVLAGDARETLAAQPAGWARAMFADPPGAIDLQGNDWDERAVAAERDARSAEMIAARLAAAEEAGA